MKQWELFTVAMRPLHETMNTYTLDELVRRLRTSKEAREAMVEGMLRLAALIDGTFDRALAEIARGKG